MNLLDEDEKRKIKQLQEESINNILDVYDSRLHYLKMSLATAEKEKIEFLEKVKDTPGILSNDNLDKYERVTNRIKNNLDRENIDYSLDLETFLYYLEDYEENFN